MPSESGTDSATVDAVDAADPRESTDEAEGVASAEFATGDSAESLDSGETRERDPIEWGPVRHDRLRSVAAGATVGIVGAVLVALVGVAAAMVPRVAAGEITLPGVGLGAGIAAAGVAVAVGVTTVPALYLWYRETSVDELSVARLREAASALRPSWAVAGFGAVLAAAVALPADFLSAFWPLFWLVWFVPAVVQSNGRVVRVDPTQSAVERTYPSQDRTRSDDLGSVIRTRRIDLPWTTLFLLAYRGNAWYRSTPWLFVPSDRADEVGSALDAALAESDGPDRASVPERLTLATVGSFSLVVGLLMAVAAGEGAGGLALALLTAPFSLLFLALAARL